jgi:putative spermidine/putrescine transport system substrate-binding protein
VRKSERNPARVAWLVIAGLVVFMLAMAGCGSSDSDSSSEAVAKKVGKGEGELNLIVWAGYAEDGSADPAYDWVSGFEDKTGCQVKSKVASTSDDMVTLMRTNQYDGVSASGDASVRLMAGGDVQPINTDLVPNYKDVYPFLKDTAYNSVDGQMYGVPHGYGANLIVYNKDDIKPAPTSLDVLFDPKEAAKYSGKISVPDNPIFIADAAVYLRDHQPDLGIDNPYELTEDQFNAAVDLLKAQQKDVGQYWPDAGAQISSFTNGDSDVGNTWQYQVSTLQADDVPVESVLPSEGSTGWSDTWMMSSAAKNPNCMYKWMDWIESPQVQADVTQYFGESPANPKACALTEKGFCETYHAGDEAFLKNIDFWQTPVSDCGDGSSDCKTYNDWVQAWTSIRG